MTATDTQFGIDLKEALHAAATNSSYAASRALTKWLRRSVRLQTKGFEQIPISEAAEFAGAADAPVAAVHMLLEGDIQGDILLVFPEAAGRRLVGVLTNGALGQAEEFGEMEQSALQETGNIVGTSFANAMAEWLDRRVVPASPAFAYDLACAVIQPVLLADAAARDAAWITKTTFEIDGERLDWCMLLLLTGDSLDRIRRGTSEEYAQQGDLNMVAVNAAFNASHALSKWLRKGVRISSAGFQREPLKKIERWLPPPDESSVVMHMAMEGQLRGSLELVLSRSSAEALVGHFMPNLPPAERLGEMGQSCLQETANIMSTAFANSVAKWLDLDARPSSPQLRIDIASAAFQGALAPQAERSDDVLVSQTTFHVEETQIECNLFVLPDPKSFRLIDACFNRRGLL